MEPLNELGESPSKGKQLVDIVKNASKIAAMKKQFNDLLKEVDDAEMPESGSSNRDTNASSMWRKVRGSIISGRVVNQETSNISISSASNVISQESLEQQDAELMEYWKQSSPAPSFSVTIPSNKPINKMVEFETLIGIETDDIALTINKIPEDMLLEQRVAQEQAVLQERINFLNEIKSKEFELLYKENQTMNRVMTMEHKARQRMRAEKEKVHEYTIDNEKKISRQFKRARESLENSIKRQYSKIREYFGELLIGQSSLSRSFAVKSEMIPQPIVMRIHVLSAVKTKLPEGNYVIMLSQAGSPGGKNLQWSHISPFGISEHMAAVTKPAKHMGRYFDRVLKVEDSVYALCPPKGLLKPSFVYILELYRLADETNPYDEVVGWATMPMCNELINLVDGKFRLPFLRGAPSPSVQHFRTIEKSMANDLQNWLCNGYVEIRRLPIKAVTDENRQGFTDIEKGIYDIDFISKNISTTIAVSDMALVASSKDSSDAASKRLQTVSGLFRRSKNTNDMDKKLSEAGMSKRSNVSNMSAFWRSSFIKQVSVDDADDDSTVNESSKTLTKSRSGLSPAPSMRALKSKPRPPSSSPPLLLKKSISASTLFKKQGSSPMPASSTVASNGNRVYERVYDSDEENFLHPQQSGKLVGVETVHNSADALYAATGLEKETTRRYQFDGPRMDEEMLHPENTASKSYDDWKQMTEFADVDYMQSYTDSFTTSLYSDPSQQKRILPTMITRTKITFMNLELFGDLSYYLIGTFDYYVTIFSFVFAFWFRIYVHFLSQYLLLASQNIPIFNFQLHVVIIFFKYMSQNIASSIDVAVVAIGPLSNILVFTMFCLLAKLSIRLTGAIPDGVSKFIASYGFVIILDPLLTLIVDLGYGNFHCHGIAVCKDDYSSAACTCQYGDFVKLWYRFTVAESSGFSGLLITLILYTGTMMLSSLLLYYYFIYIHKGGRVLDIWRRLHATEDEFFIPNDYEITHEELHSLCKRAEMWKGGDGAIRKVVIRDLPTESIDLSLHSKNKPDNPDDERTTYYGIFEVSMSGRVKLYRHFLALSDGTIIEVFDNVDTDFLRENLGLQKTQERFSIFTGLDT